MATWALIADRSHARILSTRGRGKGFELVEDITHPEGRLHDRDLETDRHGRTGDPRQVGHATETEVSASEEVAIRFANALAAKLRQGHDAHRFEHLILAAEPRFLGHLRKALDKSTSQAVKGEVHKHLLGAGDGDLAAHLDPHVPV
jgi:protein required for attachment to host cells